MFTIIINRTRPSIRFIPQTLTHHQPTNPFINRHKHTSPDPDEPPNTDPDAPPKLFVVQPRFRPDYILKIKLDEALNLANSLEEQRDGYYSTQFSDKDSPPHVVVQNPAYRITRADTYFGPGTVDNIKCHLNALDSKGGVDAVFVNGILTGIQQRNLERTWGKAVLDRVGLIIEIFHAHAQTKEAKLQAELAALMYKRTRLVRIRGSGGRLTFGAAGEAEVVSAKGRGSGGRGFISGAGETELQLQRRRIIERKNQLMSEIQEVRRTRALQRASRKRYGGTHGQHMPTVAIVGYTNAGKSTLVGALSDTHLFCDDRMFATVDTKVRHVILPSGKKVLLSDTVGFISDLPVQLVEAFHATLEEVVEADLLVHVLDSSAPNRNEQRESVLQVLEQIGVSNEKLENMIEVWNKIDLEEDAMTINEESRCEMNEDLDGWLSTGNEVNWDDASASFVGWKAFEDQPKDVSTLSGEVGSDLKPRHEVSSSLSLSLSPSPHVKTSGITRFGLQELLELVDDKLKTDKVVERSVFDRKWRPPQKQDSEKMRRLMVVHQCRQLAPLPNNHPTMKALGREVMLRKQGRTPTKRFTGHDGSPQGPTFHPKSGTSPSLSTALVLLGTFLFIGYICKSLGSSKDNKKVSKIEGDFGCTFDVQRAIPVLKRTYGDNMRKVLHVGPDTCSVVSQLIKEPEIDAWGVEPYDIEDANTRCKNLVRKGLVRVADIKFPLPYRAKSFSLVVVSDAVDYLSPKYLNKTIQDLARTSTQNLVIFTGYPIHSKANVRQLKFGHPVKSVIRSKTWWARFFVQTSLVENDVAAMKFKQAASEISYKPRCQIFHLNSYH